MITTSPEVKITGGVIMSIKSVVTGGVITKAAEIKEYQRV
jgi:hypothetical protein